jgi:beta-carotene 3-hydroxylase
VSFGFVIARDPAKLKAELKAQKAAGLAVVRDSVGAGDDSFETLGRNL